MTTKKEFEENILRLLSKHPEGLTITNVSKLLGINYMTVSKYLSILEAAGKVSYIKIGMAKLFVIKRLGIGVVEKEIEERILKVLSKHPEGLTITDVTKKSGINYMTASKYLAVLEARVQIEYTQIGMAKLFRMRGFKSDV